MNIADDLANPLERLGGSVERVTFHSEASGFCVLRVKVRGHRDLSTVIGSAASVIVGEYVECFGNWVNDRAHGLQFNASQLEVVHCKNKLWHRNGILHGLLKRTDDQLCHFLADSLVHPFGQPQTVVHFVHVAEQGEQSHSS